MQPAKENEESVSNWKVSIQSAAPPNHEFIKLPALSEFRIRWNVLIPLSLIHIGAIAAFWFFTWPAFFVFLGTWLATGCWGITVGYHRYLSHRSFEMSKAAEIFHLFWAAISMQQGPISWAKQHRGHHRYSDTISDPHPQQFGFMFGHFGWTFLSHKFLGRSPDRSHPAADLREDSVLQFFERWNLAFLVTSLLALYLVGGLPFLLWGGCFRIAWVLNITWGINSVVHRWGYRTYPTNDRSVNNPWFAILAMGEGWHNNHHRFPYSANQGLNAGEFDLSWQWIRLLEKLGLAWGIKRPK